MTAYFTSHEVVVSSTLFFEIPKERSMPSCVLTLNDLRYKLTAFVTWFFFGGGGSLHDARSEIAEDVSKFTVGLIFTGYMTSENETHSEL